MAEFICRLGTPAGEIVTRTVEAVGVQEARSRLESEGFRVFAVSDTASGLSAVLTGGGKKGKVKQADFLLCAVPDYRHLFYHFGVNHVRHIFKRGRLVHTA